MGQSIPVADHLLPQSPLSNQLDQTPLMGFFDGLFSKGKQQTQSTNALPEDRGLDGTQARSADSDSSLSASISSEASYQQTYTQQPSTTAHGALLSAQSAQSHARACTTDQEMNLNSTYTHNDAHAHAAHQSIILTV